MGPTPAPDFSQPHHPFHPSPPVTRRAKPVPSRHRPTRPPPRRSRRPRQPPSRAVAQPVAGALGSLGPRRGRRASERASEGGREGARAGSLRICVACCLLAPPKLRRHPPRTLTLHVRASRTAKHLTERCRTGDSSTLH